MAHLAPVRRQAVDSSVHGLFLSTERSLRDALRPVLQAACDAGYITASPAFPKHPILHEVDWEGIEAYDLLNYMVSGHPDVLTGTCSYLGGSHLRVADVSRLSALVFDLMAFHADWVAGAVAQGRAGAGAGAGAGATLPSSARVRDGFMQKACQLLNGLAYAAKGRPDIAARCQRHADDIRAAAPGAATTSSTAPTAPTPDHGGAAVLQEVALWKCPGCGISESELSTKCGVCSTARPTLHPDRAHSVAVGHGGARVELREPADRTCDICLASVPARSTQCGNCRHLMTALPAARSRSPAVATPPQPAAARADVSWGGSATTCPNCLYPLAKGSKKCWRCQKALPGGAGR